MTQISLIQSKAPESQSPRATYPVVSLTYNAQAYSKSVDVTYSRVEHAATDTIKDPDIDSETDTENRSDI